MSRIEEVANLINANHTPAAIARQLGIQLDSVLGYLDRAVGETYITRSDIFFTIPEIVCAAYFDANSGDTFGQIQRRLSDAGADCEIDDIIVVDRYADETFGDMYAMLRRVEVRLHGMIKETLQEAYGIDESGWWRQGVPVTIRQKCCSRHQEDDEPVVDPFAYTDLIDLSKIIERQWAIFKDKLPASVRSNRQELIQNLERMNRIRRCVMHPVRGIRPTQVDFAFVRELKGIMNFG